MSAKNLLWLLPVITLAACGQNRAGNGYGAQATTAPAAMQADTTVAAAAGTPITSPARKVIHTADFRCKVQNVFSATTLLEQLVKNAGGVVQDSHIDNSGYDTKTTFYTADSLKQTQTYTTTSALTLRVPVASVDSIIQAIPGMTSFIDSRTLRQTDVTYQYLGNELKNQVGNEQQATTRAMALAKTSKEPIAVQQYDKDRQEEKIDRKLQNMQLQDNVSYATVTIAFSQPEQVFVQTIVNPDYVTRTPFILQCKAGLYNGWSLIRGITVALINIWPLLLLAIAAWMTMRRYKAKKVLPEQA